MDDSVVERVKCNCSHTLIIVKPNGIELKCDSCKSRILYSWRKVLMMMLAAEMATTPQPMTK